MLGFFSDVLFVLLNLTRFLGNIFDVFRYLLQIVCVPILCGTLLFPKINLMWWTILNIA